MTQEIIPLKPGQHAVTSLPKFTTELPFFYLTKQATELNKPIHFESTDTQGKPVRWKVSPNTDKDIGAPSIKAHQVWVRLIKPAIDARRLKENEEEKQAIVPLGTARHCLTLLGWKIGGWEAQDLLKAINQIGAAWCTADFWLPTSKLDESGKPTFKRVKTSYSRLSLYAIGETHVTEEELKSGKVNFDFDLSDILYIQLHEIETLIQRYEGTRPIDNEYLFSVSPAARRWYELLAPKFYGVTKNAKKGDPPGHCEIRYSWYIERHHTLTRQKDLRRIRMQMNKLIKDHLLFGFVLRADYRPLKEANGEGDYIIRYYPGQFAHETTTRILTRLKDQRRPWLKPSKQLALPLPLALSEGEADLIKDDETIIEPVIITEDNDQEPTLIKRLVQAGVTESVARELSSKDAKECESQLEALPYRSRVEDKGGYLVRAIRDRYAMPSKMEEAKQKEQKALEHAERLRQHEEAQAHQRAGDTYDQFFEPSFREHQRLEFETIQAQHPEAYALFKAYFDKAHGKAMRMITGDRNRERFTLRAAVTFFNVQNPELELRLSTFEEWDRDHNPQRRDPLEWFNANPQQILDELDRRLRTND